MVYVAKEKLWATILCSHQCFLIYVLFRIQIPFFSFLVSDKWYHNHHRAKYWMRWDMHLAIFLTDTANAAASVMWEPTPIIPAVKWKSPSAHEARADDRQQAWDLDTYTCLCWKQISRLHGFLLAIWTPFPGMSLFLIWQSRRGHWLLESPCHFC